MYLLRSEGENKLHLSIFWKPFVCTQEIKKRQDTVGYSLLHKVSERVCTHVTTTVRSFLFLTFERLVELVLPEHDPEVVNGAGVELHPEYHVAARAAVALVVALELWSEKKKKQQSEESQTKLNSSSSSTTQSRQNSTGQSDGVWLQLDGFIFSSGSAIKRFSVRNQMQNWNASIVELNTASTLINSRYISSERNMKRAGDAPARFSASSVFPLTPRPLDTYVPRNVWPLHKHYYPNCLRATLKFHTGKSSASLLLFPDGQPGPVRFLTRTSHLQVPEEYLASTLNASQTAAVNSK